MRDWLLDDTARVNDLGQMLSSFAEGLNALGVPVHRMITAIDALHSEYAGIGPFGP